jgi:hypothetical protein
VQIDDRRVVSVFREGNSVLQKLESRLSLSPEEAQDFEERVFLWFSRFSRRAGNEGIPRARFETALVSAACHLAVDLGKQKGVVIPIQDLIEGNEA